MKYRKKHGEVEAIQFNGAHNIDEVKKFCGKSLISETHHGCEVIHLYIKTREGILYGVYPGDYIIREEEDAVYSLKPDVFEQTYEPVEDKTERVYKVHWKPDKVFKTQAERDAYIYGYGDGHEDGCSDGRAQALETIDGCAEETVKKVEEHKRLHMTLLAQQYDTELMGILRARQAIMALKGVEDD